VLLAFGAAVVYAAASVDLSTALKSGERLPPWMRSVSRLREPRTQGIAAARALVGLVVMAATQLFVAAAALEPALSVGARAVLVGEIIVVISWTGFLIGVHAKGGPLRPAWASDLSRPSQVNRQLFRDRHLNLSRVAIVCLALMLGFCGSYLGGTAEVRTLGGLGFALSALAFFLTLLVLAALSLRSAGGEEHGR